jgi:hypothetical protein
MSHTYIKSNPDQCILCLEIKGIPFVNWNGEKCSHDCSDRELQGDGRWIWCDKCKTFIDPAKLEAK